MRHKYAVYLAKCGHFEEVLMSISTAIYRRRWLKELPMETKCTFCCSSGRHIVRKVVRIETNNAEQLYLAKAMGASNNE